MNDAQITIRPADLADANAISQVVLSALQSNNAKDYTPEIIARVAESFSPAGVAALMARRDVFVAVEGSRVVGTASLDGQVVRTVFLAPDRKQKGIGPALMQEIERLACERGRTTLVVPSSLPPRTSMPGWASRPFVTAIMGSSAPSSRNARFSNFADRDFLNARECLPRVSTAP